MSELIRMVLHAFNWKKESQFIYRSRRDWVWSSFFCLFSIFVFFFLFLCFILFYWHYLTHLVSVDLVIYMSLKSFLAQTQRNHTCLFLILWCQLTTIHFQFPQFLTVNSICILAFFLHIQYTLYTHLIWLLSFDHVTYKR